MVIKSTIIYHSKALQNRHKLSLGKKYNLATLVEKRGQFLGLPLKISKNCSKKIFTQHLAKIWPNLVTLFREHARSQVMYTHACIHSWREEKAASRQYNRNWKDADDIEKLHNLDQWRHKSISHVHRYFLGVVVKYKYLSTYLRKPNNGMTKSRGIANIFEQLISSYLATYASRAQNTCTHVHVCMLPPILKTLKSVQIYQAFHLPK
jgi:hypothetical protein